MLEDLNNKLLENKSSIKDLIEKYVRFGLEKEVDTMLMVSLNTDVTEKVNIVSKLTDRTPEEVVNDTLWIQFQKVEDIPDEIDYDKIWGMLDHDKPEGDDVLVKKVGINSSFFNTTGRISSDFLRYKLH